MQPVCGRSSTCYCSSTSIAAINSTGRALRSTLPRSDRSELGKKSGPSPTDRARPGSKHHLLVDGNGSPLVVILSAANEHDVTKLVALVTAIPPIAGRVGRPRFRPKCIYGDRAYDSPPHRRYIHALGIRTKLAKKGVAHGTGLGKIRWVVERTISWLHQYRRLRVRFERRADIHQAWLYLACAHICWKKLRSSFC